jgi:CHAT domain-containing protein
VLHIATHGILRWDEPMLSALRLADTWLNSHDACELDLGAELVVLAACESGSASVTAGGDPLGVTRGFLCAGATALLVSQWRVNDGVTAELMEAFYTGFRGGSGAVEALHAAMASVRARRPHPYYWAPFFLLGCPSEAPVRAGEGSASERTMP